MDTRLIKRKLFSWLGGFALVLLFGYAIYLAYDTTGARREREQFASKVSEEIQERVLEKGEEKSVTPTKVGGISSWGTKTNTQEAPSGAGTLARQIVSPLDGRKLSIYTWSGGQRIYQDKIEVMGSNGERLFEATSTSEYPPKDETIKFGTVWGFTSTSTVLFTTKSDYDGSTAKQTNYSFLNSRTGNVSGEASCKGNSDGERGFFESCMYDGINVRFVARNEESGFTLYAEEVPVYWSVKSEPILLDSRSLTDGIDVGFASTSVKRVGLPVPVNIEGVPSWYLIYALYDIRNLTRPLATVPVVFDIRGHALKRAEGYLDHLGSQMK